MFASVFSISAGYAQDASLPDLVVTLDYDSIACDILAEDDEQLEVKLNYEGMIQEAIIRKEHTVAIIRDYYTQPTTDTNYEVPVFEHPSTPTPVNLSEQPLVKPKLFRLEISGGFSRRLGSTPPNTDPAIQEHYNRLKSGFSYSIAAGALLFEDWGFGIRYDYFRSQSTINNASIVFQNPPLTFTGRLEESVQINTFGPEFLAKTSILNGDGEVAGKAGLYYTWFKDEITEIAFISTKGKSITLRLGADLNYFLTRSLAFRIGGSITTGSVSEFDFVGPTGTATYTVTSDEAESLTRIDVGVGLLFLF